jgi:hypothetical protein
MRIVSLNSVPQKTTRGVIGITDLIPSGDRGPTFGKSSESSISETGKIGGFWTAPYDGIITAVTMSIDQGGATIVFRRKRGARGGIPGSEDVINKNGYTIGKPGGGGVHKVFTNLSDLTDVNVFKGDVFTTEIVDLFDPKPTDIGGNILVTQTDGSMPGAVESIRIT